MALDVGGTRAALSERAIRGDEIEDIAVALGEDGTAVVAWTVEHPQDASYRSRVWVSTRAAGAPFGPVAAVATAGGVSQVAAGVRSDGTVELTFDPGQTIAYLELRPGGPAGAPVPITTYEGAMQNLALVPGGPGRSRVMVFEDRVSRSARAGRPLMCCGVGEASEPPCRGVHTNRVAFQRPPSSLTCHSVSS